MSGPLSLVRVHQQGGTLTLTAQDQRSGEVSEWPLIPSTGSWLHQVFTVMDAAQPPTGRFLLVIAQNLQGTRIEAPGPTLVLADHVNVIECDKFQADEVRVLWGITVLLDRYPQMPFLEGFQVGERFITLTLRQHDGTFSRARLDRRKAGIHAWNEDRGWITLQRDTAKSFTRKTALGMTAVPYQLKALLSAFGWAESEEVRALPQAAD